jgi:hypothetical protein
VQRRAWECGYDLISSHLDALDPIARHIAGWIAARKPERLTWDDCREAFALHRRFVST